MPTALSYGAVSQPLLSLDARNDFASRIGVVDHLEQMLKILPWAEVPGLFGSRVVETGYFGRDESAYLDFGRPIAWDATEHPPLRLSSDLRPYSLRRVPLPRTATPDILVAAGMLHDGADAVARVNRSWTAYAADVLYAAGAEVLLDASSYAATVTGGALAPTFDWIALFLDIRRKLRAANISERSPDIVVSISEDVYTAWQASDQVQLALSLATREVADEDQIQTFIRRKLGLPSAQLVVLTGGYRDRVGVYQDVFSTHFAVTWSPGVAGERRFGDMLVGVPDLVAGESLGDALPAAGILRVETERSAALKGEEWFADLVFGAESHDPTCGVLVTDVTIPVPGD